MAEQEDRTPKRKASVTRKTIGYFWWATKRHWPWFLGAVLSTVGYVFLLNFMNPFLMGKVIDLVAEGRAEPDTVFAVFGPIIIVLILVNVFGQICSKLQDYFDAKTTILANYDLMTYAFDTLSNQSMTFYSNRFGGSLVAQVQRFVSAYTNLVDRMVYSFLPLVSSVTFTVVLLLPSVPLYVALLAVVLFIYVVVVYKLYSSILPANAKAASAGNVLSGQLADSISNIMAVKTSGRELASERRISAFWRPIPSACARTFAAARRPVASSL